MILILRLLLTALCLAVVLMLNAYGDSLLTNRISAAPVVNPREAMPQAVAEPSR